MKPPIRLWQGALIALFVALAIWSGYIIYHMHWGRLAH